MTDIGLRSAPDFRNRNTVKPVAWQWMTWQHHLFILCVCWWYDTDVQRKYTVLYMGTSLSIMKGKVPEKKWLFGSRKTMQGWKTMCICNWSCVVYRNSSQKLSWRRQSSVALWSWFEAWKYPDDRVNAPCSDIPWTIILLETLHQSSLPLCSTYSSDNNYGYTPMLRLFRHATYQRSYGFDIWSPDHACSRSPCFQLPW